MNGAIVARVALPVPVACASTSPPKNDGGGLDRAEIRERLADQGYPWIDDLIQKSDGSWRADAFGLGSRTTLEINRDGHATLRL